MTGSPTSGSYGSPGSMGSTGYTGYSRAHRVSPPNSKKEAEQHIGWLSVARPQIITKFDDFIEGEKQYSDKEAKRQQILQNEAREHQAKMDQHAREKEEWKARMRAREEKERYEREYKANERKIQMAEWKEALVHEPGHGPLRWLWPTARDHPRAWVANTDIPLKAADQERSLTWNNSPGARAQVVNSPALHQIPGS
eukprot:CAMPEP_0174710678 /NCGR_PEP_ID=MMETSP1094-20130205/12224_1 /TAXON_ID=156173 /ORGANISM="Chrysochromulina brevifilum, Strain UTEX LB 985" /LENGTH=196 /DNA_ID=CAMNT_0015909507 /DNA_START=119 /DNA_END=709 /DNA_ORIENTATION=-